ncbi:MAG: L-threonylcarbamoyladenylate synthase, partial [Anaerolineales bacterium]
IEAAVLALRRGELVALPTDTVYGLAANVWDGQAVTRLFEVKGRDPLKAVALLLAGWDGLLEVAEPPLEYVRRLAARFWPGPLTLVVKRLASLPAEVSPTDTIGLRVPDHPFALKLLAQVGPLAVTSANRSGSADSRTAAEVLAALSGRIELVIDGGETPGGVPSSVVDCTADSPALLRSGLISMQEIEAALRA